MNSAEASTLPYAEPAMAPSSEPSGLLPLDSASAVCMVSVKRRDARSIRRARARIEMLLRFELQRFAARRRPGFEVAQ